MRFIFTAIFAVMAYLIYPSGIFDIPFSQLTLENYFRFAGTILFAVIAISVLFERNQYYV
jgi:putative Ca2+/H+ antiporter (TMEM165/GDT1 family)